MTDSICISHMCCSQHNCHILLHSGKNHFCPIHASLNDLCSIVDCGNKIVDSLLTCDNIEHQEIERLHCERGQSCFQLHKQLEHTHAIIHLTAPESNSWSLLQHTMLDNDDEQFTINLNGCVTADSPNSEKVPQDPSATKSKKVRAKFAQSRMHNVQLTVTPCGMILGWDTMFGAEGIARVAVSCLSFAPIRHILITHGPPGIYQAHISC